MIKITDFTALVLARKEPFYHWLEEANQQSRGDDDNAYAGDHGNYLVKDVHTQAEVEVYLKANFRILWENELREWHEPSLWPQNMNYELFCQWYDVQVHRQVYELSDKQEE